MRLGRWQFARKRGSSPETPPGAAVTGLSPWLLCAAIIASSAALLGTSDDTPSSVPSQQPPGDTRGFVTYEFERLGVEGGGVDLTTAAPSATFYVNIRADGLGPDGVTTTDSAVAVVDALITSSGFGDGTAAPFVNFSLRALGGNRAAQQQALEHFQQSLPLVFSGNCAKPTEGAACSASFALEISRLDDGASDGTLHVEWTFDLSSQTQVRCAPCDFPDKQDPPWTVEVVQ